MQHFMNISILLRSASLLCCWIMRNWEQLGNEGRLTKWFVLVGSLQILRKLLLNCYQDSYWSPCLCNCGSLPVAPRGGEPALVHSSHCMDLQNCHPAPNLRWCWFPWRVLSIVCCSTHHCGPSPGRKPASPSIRQRRSTGMDVTLLSLSLPPMSTSTQACAHLYASVCCLCMWRGWPGHSAMAFCFEQVLTKCSEPVQTGEIFSIDFS